MKDNGKGTPKPNVTVVTGGEEGGGGGGGGGGIVVDGILDNLFSRGKVDPPAIFGNPIYARLIGNFDEINQEFDGRLSEVVAEMRKSFNVAA